MASKSILNYLGLTAFGNADGGGGRDSYGVTVES
jgi:hypothetical protein